MANATKKTMTNKTTTKTCAKRKYVSQRTNPTKATLLNEIASELCTTKKSLADICKANSGRYNGLNVADLIPRQGAQFDEISSMALDIIIGNKSADQAKLNKTIESVAKDLTYGQVSIVADIVVNCKK